MKLIGMMDSPLCKTRGGFSGALWRGIETCRYRSL